MFRFLPIVGLTAGMFFMMTSAQAEPSFELCNKTKYMVRYAKALNHTNTDEKRRPRIVSEGWFTLPPNECTVLWPGKLEYRYYLIYAEAANSNRKWSGDRSICVASKDFKITGDLCPASRSRRMFIEVDTGDEESYTYELR